MRVYKMEHKQGGRVIIDIPENELILLQNIHRGKSIEDILVFLIREKCSPNTSLISSGVEVQLEI